MKYIEIQLDLILPGTNFMRDKTDRYDILGQIYWFFHIDVPVNTRTPQEIDHVFYPFTIKERQKVLNSPITLQILSFNKLSPMQQVKMVRPILLPYKMHILSIQEREAMLKGIPDFVKPDKLIPSESLKAKLENEQ